MILCNCPAAIFFKPGNHRPLDADASGLTVLSQDGRVWRSLTEDAADIEHEYLVEVSGELAPYGLPKLNQGLSYGGRELPRCKVSWQNENRLRIGRIPLSKGPEGAMPAGQWRYLPVGETF
ncbi:hypothetical protein BH11PSE14_BH11PSE14_03860 [soil metagenome]